MSDIFNTGYSQLHLLNLALHIGIGTFAIALGIAQYFTKKGSTRHVKIGHTYARLFAAVLLTAIFGTFMFGFRSFLAALTLSATYVIISALRVTRIKNSGPRILDNILSVVFFSAAVVLMASPPAHELDSPLVINIVLANVLAICLYDLARNINGARWLKRSWLNEHIFKMISSHSALIGAATGNMFRDLQPWSIIVPTQICFVLIIVFIIRNPLPKEPHAM